MNSEKDTDSPHSNRKQPERHLETTVDIRNKMKTFYRISLISTSVSACFIIVMLCALWVYVKDQRLEKINRIYDSFIRQQEKEEGASLSKLSDNQASGISFTGKPIGEHISELKEETKRSISILSKEINDNIAHLLRPPAKHLKEEKGASPNNEDGKAAFERAKTLWLKGDIVTAELYFSYAISKDPDNWGYIDVYTQAILGWCKETKGDADKKTALLVLNNLEDFLRNQVHNLKLGDLIKLEKLLGSVMGTRDKLEIELEKEETDRVLAKAKDLLSQRSPDNIPSLKQFHSTLGEVHAFLKEGDLRKSEKDASDIFSSLEKRMTNIEVTRHALDLIRQVEDSLKLAEKGANPTPIHSSYVATAVTVLNQLMAYESQLEQPTAGKVRKLISRLDRVTKNLSRKRNDAILKELLEEKKKYNEFFTINPDKTCAEAIDKLTNIARLCEYRLAEITEQEFYNHVYDILNATNRAISQWKTQQLYRYEKWVVEKIKKFYETGMKKESGVKEEDDIYSKFIATFGDIDTRYLSFAAARTYTEIFDLFYKDLTDKQKIGLTAKIALIDKKKLNSF